jgi:hypothetical protein
MTDPSGYVADQIGQQSAGVPAGVPEADIAQAAHASAGLGVTEADLDAIKAQLASFQAQLNQAVAAQRAIAPDALTSSVAALNVQLANHGDPVAIELGKDAAEAAAGAADSGDTGALSSIVSRIAQHLKAHPAAPGDQFHYRQVLDTAAVHIPDVIDAVKPVEQIGADVARVVAGSVVG